MSFESESNRVVYVVREQQSCDWFDLVTNDDVVVLVENAVYRQSHQLPSLGLHLALASDCAARAVTPAIDTIDFPQWVELVANSAQTIRV
ncbi:DsrH/TusB family sulfur relay protein [Neiella marina]|uniref:DsrH/TusB family sulfur relay protein n=1 Tax=Neiella holothuriorum TaxID=2870530 RepID=A0ABS7EJC3_9GAMM|nr:DsrH/TusB family sulfur relay protein [Neiella holothuriorum]MBW8192436.1 DsrH/TusB family sulfur relay protein [Neiella holothuriorum]